MKKQRGQTLIEFALVFPLFLLIIFGTVYVGLLYGDYLTYSDMTRAAAREAAIVGTQTYSDGRTDYRAVQSKYQSMINNHKMNTNLYSLKDIVISKTGSPTSGGEPANSVKVQVMTELNERSWGYAFAKVVKAMGVSLAGGYTITYYMYDEANKSS